MLNETIRAVNRFKWFTRLNDQKCLILVELVTDLFIYCSIKTQQHRFMSFLILFFILVFLFPVSSAFEMLLRSFNDRNAIKLRIKFQPADRYWWPFLRLFHLNPSQWHCEKRATHTDTHRERKKVLIRSHLQPTRAIKCEPFRRLHATR